MAHVQYFTRAHIRWSKYYTCDRQKDKGRLKSNLAFIKICHGLREIGYVLIRQLVTMEVRLHIRAYITNRFLRFIVRVCICYGSLRRICERCMNYIPEWTGTNLWIFLVDRIHSLKKTILSEVSCTKINLTCSTTYMF